MKEIDKKGASLMDKRIESIQNPKVKEWKKLQTKKGRMQYRQFFIEGEHLIEEAIKHQSRVDVLLAVENTDVPVKWLEQITQMYWVTPVVMKYLSQIETSQGIAAICSMPVYDLELKNGCSYLLVDRVQDPGNFGTLIRTAEAIGVQAVLYTKGTVDVYNDKVVRATQGAIFHFPILEVDGLVCVHSCQEKGIPVYGSALQYVVHYQEVAPSNEFMLIVGNEGGGIDQHLLNQTTQNIYLPILGQSESLNVAVAAGILLYYLKSNKLKA